MAWQPRLCATSTGGDGTATIAASSAATQSSHTGAVQLRCCTRRYSGCAFSQRLCQCSGPELSYPGRISTGRALTRSVYRREARRRLAARSSRRGAARHVHTLPGGGDVVDELLLHAEEESPRCVGRPRQLPGDDGRSGLLAV